MKNPDRNTVAKLEELPNIGKAIAQDLQLIGIDHPKQLIGKDAYQLYETLCEALGKAQDPCVLDVFLSAIDFMKGGEPRSWWLFTEQRKNYLSKYKQTD